jgi:hypothetical protein
MMISNNLIQIGSHNALLAINELLVNFLYEGHMLGDV